MGTKPGVGEDSVILDLPSEAGAPIETDQMLHALAPSSRDFVDRVPLRTVDRGAATAVGRSAKTRVAGVPVLEGGGSTTQMPPPFLPGRGPSMPKRIAAFGASLGLSFAIGLPFVLKVDGLLGAPLPPPPVAVQPATPSAPPPVAVPPPPPANPATAQPEATAATTASPATPTGPKGTSGKPVQGAAKSATPAPASPPPTNPVAAAPTPPAAATPATPATAAPANTLQHGALIQ